MKKTKTGKQDSYNHHYKEVEKKLYPISFIHIWRTFEYQVGDMYASPQIQAF